MGKDDFCWYVNALATEYEREAKMVLTAAEVLGVYIEINIEERPSVICIMHFIDQFLESIGATDQECDLVYSFAFRSSTDNPIEIEGCIIENAMELYNYLMGDREVLK